MTAVDQAFIKAYSSNGSLQQPAAGAVRATKDPGHTSGAFFRLDASHVANPDGSATGATGHVPAPHLRLLARGTGARGTGARGTGDSPGQFGALSPTPAPQPQHPTGPTATTTAWPGAPQPLPPSSQFASPGPGVAPRMDLSVAAGMRPTLAAGLAQEQTALSNRQRGAEEEAIEENATADVIETQQPQWEVDGFYWDAICDELMMSRDTAFRQVASRISQGLDEHDKARNIVLVTSASRGEGRTTLSLCVARALAKAGKQVAVVDADLTQSRLASRLNIQVVVAWNEQDSSELDWTEAALYSLEDKLTILPLKASVLTSDVPATGGAAQQLIEQLSRRFDLVIVDTPPLDDVSGSIMLTSGDVAKKIAIVVRNVKSSDGSSLDSTLTTLRGFNLHIAGIVENFVDDPKADNVGAEPVAASNDAEVAEKAGPQSESGETADSGSTGGPQRTTTDSQ